MHMDEDASYPKLSRSNAKESIGSINQYKGRGKLVNNSRNFEHSREKIRICYNFKNNGYCKFGRDCKYQHVSNRPPFKSHPVRPSVRPASLSTSSDLKFNSSEFNSLLGSMKDIVGQLKSMMELQRQNVMSTQVNYQPQQFVPFVGQGQPF